MNNRETREPNRKNQASPLVIILLAIIALSFITIAIVLVSGFTGFQRAGESLQSLPGQLLEGVDQYINPTPTITIDPVSIIKQIQSLSRLETASYTIEKVITAEAGNEDVFSALLFGDRLLLVAQGQVIAGVDLGRLADNDLRIVDNTAYLTLPAAEIFVATLDNENTYVYDRQTGLLGQQVDLETRARQEAEAAILETALEDGILQMAQQNAELFLSGFIQSLGFDEVMFIEATPSPDATTAP